MGLCEVNSSIYSRFIGTLRFDHEPNLRPTEVLYQKNLMGPKARVKYTEVLIVPEKNSAASQSLGFRVSPVTQAKAPIIDFNYQGDSTLTCPITTSPQSQKMFPFVSPLCKPHLQWSSHSHDWSTAQLSFIATFWDFGSIA